MSTEEKHLHIVAFDIPYPPDYGGVIDIFFKLKALHEQGVQIILHTFKYSREEASELEIFCSEVHYYERNMGLKSALHKRPYIVFSRKSDEMLERLLQDNYPILFEGLHTTAWLNHPELEKRRKLVRAHNVEHDYYKGLAESETQLKKKVFFKTEAEKLKKYESVLKQAQKILAISKNDFSYFAGKYGNTS